MAQRKPEEKAFFEEVQKLVDALVPEERARLYRHLQFRFWDEEWNQIGVRLDEERALNRLPPATDQDVHDAVDATRTSDDWDDLRHEIQKGIDQLDRGEGIPAEQVFFQLRQRNKSFQDNAVSAEEFAGLPCPGRDQSPLQAVPDSAQSGICLDENQAHQLKAGGDVIMYLRSQLEEKSQLAARKI